MKVTLFSADWLRDLYYYPTLPQNTVYIYDVLAKFRISLNLLTVRVAHAYIVMYIFNIEYVYKWYFGQVKEKMM